MFCSRCGVQYADSSSFCPACGAPAGAVRMANTGKSRTAYVLLAFFLGVYGIHNFYAGYTQKAVIQLLLTVCSCWTLSLIVFIWNIVEMCTVETDANGAPMV